MKNIVGGEVEGIQGYGEVRGSKVSPDGLLEGHIVAGQQLWSDAAQSSQHGPARVDDLQLPVLGKGLWVGGEPGSVPAVVCTQRGTDRSVGKGEPMRFKVSWLQALLS